MPRGCVVGTAVAEHVSRGIESTASCIVDGTVDPQVSQYAAHISGGP